MKTYLLCYGTIPVSVEKVEAESLEEATEKFKKMYKGNLSNMYVRESSNKQFENYPPSLPKKDTEFTTEGINTTYIIIFFVAALFILGYIVGSHLTQF